MTAAKKAKTATKTTRNREPVASDEKIVAALITHGTVAEVAKACKITPRTVYNRMQDKDFKALYLAAKTDVVRTASCTLNKHLTSAINATAEVMSDPDTPPATRVQAANIIMNHALKLAARVETEEDRVEIVDTAAADVETKMQEELQNAVNDQMAAIMDMFVDILTVEQRHQLVKMVHDPEQLEKKRLEKEKHRQMYFETTGRNIYTSERETDKYKDDDWK